ncbi:MAG: hypothetical protein OER86_08070, partial [Phycisphaerae bacterium]|nr:hypothetical protein [Phycisphaerae bacterium]
GDEELVVGTSGDRQTFDGSGGRTEAERGRAKVNWNFGCPAATNTELDHFSDLSLIDGPAGD